MRTLNINKITLWKVDVTGFTDETDVDGNFTGEQIPVYSAPVKIRVMLYPITGRIKRDFLGVIHDEDYVIATNDVLLDKDALLFRTEPVSDYDTTFDYMVISILKSINTTLYTVKSGV